MHCNKVIMTEGKPGMYNVQCPHKEYLPFLLWDLIQAFLLNQLWKSPQAAITQSDISSKWQVSTTYKAFLPELELGEKNNDLNKG